MKVDYSFLDGLKSFLPSKIDKDKIISIFATGSIVDNQITSLSDIDIIIIGKKDNDIFHLRELQNQFREFFRSNLKIEPIFFAEPSFERTFYINNPIPSSPLVHLIYHPIDRFLKYISQKDPVLFSWKMKHKLLFGEDVLYKVDFDPKQVKSSLLINLLDDLLQTIHNLFLVTDIHKHFNHYLKTFLYCSKRLIEFLTFGFFDIIPIECNLLKQKYTEILEGIQQNPDDENYLVNLLKVLEDDLLSIKSLLLERQKGASNNSG